MKRIESSNLKAMIGRKYGNGYLATRSNTLEEIKAEIDFANDRARLLGYKTDEFTIICEETYLYLDDDGNFVKREIYEGIVEVYPNPEAL